MSDMMAGRTRTNVTDYGQGRPGKRPRSHPPKQRLQTTSGRTRTGRRLFPDD